jgi:hypothetical protein
MEVMRFEGHLSWISSVTLLPDGRRAISGSGDNTLRLWDLGFQRSSEDRVGMLFWRAHRCARIITTLRFHLVKMTPQEMVDFLVKRVGHEPAGAEAEVRRWFDTGFRDVDIRWKGEYSWTGTGVVTG